MLGENLKMALSALVANKMRSFLTMLGIIIGIGAVIITTSLGDTVRKMFADIFDNVGLTQSFVQVTAEDYRESDYFTEDDVDHFYDIFEGRLVYIDYSDSAQADVKTDIKAKKMGFNGVDYKYAQLQRSMKMIYGRFLNEADIRNQLNSCVIKDTDALVFFGTENAVGRKFRSVIQGESKEFTVVGVYKEEISPFQKVLMGVKSDDGVIYIPLSLFKANHNGAYMLRIFSDPEASIEETEKFTVDFKNYIVRYKKRTDKEYTIYNAGEQFSQVDGVLGTVSLVIGAIAAISLLVGGIGIMNIMLVSVTERTREIGIRKALGATTRDILQQFLIESAVLSAVGGIMGVILAVVIVSLVGVLTATAVVIKPFSIIIGVGFSALVGLFFGIYPANKAAKKDPIEALRFE